MKLKRFLSGLSAAAVALSAMALAPFAAANAADVVASGDCGDNVTWTLDSEGVLTVSGEGGMYTDYYSYGIDYYDDWDSNPWTYLDNSEGIKEVIVEEGVTSIGYGAFYKLPNLETVVLPSTITEFSGGDKIFGTSTDGRWDKVSYSFAECTNLKNLTLTEGMTCIGGYAFAGCTSLESVTVPSTITKWGEYSFYQCTSLKDIILEEGITVMGCRAFSQTAVESVVIPSTIENWMQSVYRDRSVTIPETQSNLAFAECENLTSVTFAEGLKTIKNTVFYNCTSLKKVVIPASVTDISYAFYNCTGLEEVRFAEGSELTALSAWSFAYCENLKVIDIPRGVTELTSGINNNSFNGCSSLESIYFYGTESLYMSDYMQPANSTVKYYCYTDTEMYNTLIKTQSHYSWFKGVGDITEVISSSLNDLNIVLNEAKGLDEKAYTSESYSALKELIEEAENYDENYYILNIRAMTEELESAIDALENRVIANYTAVDEAIAKIPADLSIYTDETAQAVTDAVAAVVYDLDISHQSEADAWAKAIENAIAGLELKTVELTGTVTGTVKVSDEDDSTEMTIVAVSADGTKASTTAASMGTYVIEGLEAGEYTLTISGGKYAERSYDITVEAGENAQDVELNPYGDINGDGKVTTADVGMVNSHAKGISILEDYKFVCANVSGDEIISTADVGMINSHAKGVKVLW